jgi:hypothetical protein
MHRHKITEGIAAEQQVAGRGQQARNQVAGALIA